MLLSRILKAKLQVVHSSIVAPHGSYCDDEIIDEFSVSGGDLEETRAVRPRPSRGKAAC